MAGPRASQPQLRIQSLARASRILDVVAQGEVVALASIAAATRLNKTTAFYLVETLAALGFVERVEGRGYRLGLRNLELGRAVQRRLDIAAISRPSLLNLCLHSRETVNLAVPYVFDTMIVESLEGAHGVRATSYAGSRAPYHSTACGKAILAFLDPDVRAALYKARPLIRITPNTITDERALEAQLATVRARGFAFDIAENELGAHCVAAPIHDGLGDIAGAISISGLATRWPKRLLVELGAAIVQETKAISARLGDPEAAPEPRVARRGAGERRSAGAAATVHASARSS